MRADRISFTELFLFILMMVNTLRLNNHWTKQHQTISSGIFVGWNIIPAAKLEFSQWGSS